MKFLIALVCLLSTLNSCPQVICEGKLVVPTEEINLCETNWQLVFQDEFLGDSLNTSYWDIREGVIRDPVFSDQKGWLEKANVQIKDGVLYINAKCQTSEHHCFDIWTGNGVENFCGDFKYSSGEIWTKDFFDYGKFEAMIKIPSGKGLWPAFWLFGQNPRYNEIDIFEFRHDDSRDHNMDVHYDPDFSGNLSCPTDYRGPDFSECFHKFELVWSPTFIQWLVDGKIVRTDYKYYTELGQGIRCNINAWKKVIMNLNFPSEPMQLILNIAIEANEHAPDNKTVFPTSMEVDWVKVYKMVP